MKIAYGVMLHEKPYQFEWLYKAIYSGHDVFAIHVDAACSAALFTEFLRLAVPTDNVFYVERQRALWGGWAIAQIELDLIQILLERDSTWTHFVNLSGTCYPLQSRFELLRCLAANPYANYVELEKISESSDYVRRRVSYVHKIVGGYFRRTEVPKVASPLFSIDWVGSNWHVLTRAFCEWVINDPVALHICRHLSDIGIPDEHLMQCLLINGPFSQTVAPISREILWEPESYHPITLVSQHEEMLLRSTKFFARKFDAAVDAAILEKLAQRISAPIPFDPTESR